MKITAVRKQKRSSSRVNVYIDGEYRLSLAAEIALRAGLGVGRELTEGEIRALEAEDAAWSAKESALRLLAVRPRTRDELRRRLERRSVPPPAVERCLEELGAAGLLDDREFARSFVRDRIRSKPKGRRALHAELRARGVSPDDSQQALDDLLPDDEVDLARAALRKFRTRPGEAGEASRRRMHGFLMRRGFSAEAIRVVLEELPRGPQDRGDEPP